MNRTSADPIGSRGTDSGDAVTPIEAIVWRSRAVVEGRIRSLRVRPWGDNPTLEVVLVDETGAITLVFLARRKIAGLRLGTRLQAEGTVGSLNQRPAIINPRYTIQPAADLDPAGHG